MIKRKTILSIFILIFLTINLVGCKNLSQQTKEDIYEDFQKKITKMTSYTCHKTRKSKWKNNRIQ